MASQPLKWHGGKSYLAKWILSNFPPRDSYTHYLEPYAGGLSVLFAHDPEGKSEAVNDLNRGLSDFWYVLANTPDRMLRMLWGTPLAQHVWEDACAQVTADSDRVRRATAFFIKYRQSRQGLGKDFVTPTRRVRRGMNENVSAYWSAIEGLPEAHERLKRVEIRSMPALKFINMHDHENAFFYLDTPYLHETRATESDYEHEMSVDDHCELLEKLLNLKGKFLLSGYWSTLYGKYARAGDWCGTWIDIDNKASPKKSKDKKTEYLFSNYTPGITHDAV